ncbi:bifunctional 3-deoxy-7-phosphoheptulonate synthase/chorismate mutase [Salisediminibacterium halotolerans]|uniref:3-deoxy-D-arabinoheptulosonate-7-phosphate synthase /chorismate mutase n=1 Tax=Salisediminibacterium halotolerans TaxID=517425 RepID=A0A1H9V7R4_9BACI|nr:MULTISPECIES: bifunctional 3-deoxy-7-phosphoheptulonate synthase/chorismate mutase [Salisediminibacterium]RLJ69389.1 3-deoxy-D-arabinoheptulosonate-7-phosphate synthase /chorismate mutase [Actinophytocola xinjiangensis]RPE83985.1 3-deoxy-D-arabinoheptulosonate-7-phosphate synthase /chorismate mutase [Salisediminibacterium halotolerans]TWG32464.1 3-deoxy-D-arabinoheptulosonate-7-phosphate synthase /chorismate mutase [Salisediminibacterium halotolerans]SES17618.1 3-deoxy-D-arabinoheptulosonate
MGNEQLEELRGQLDEVNEQLVELISKRAEIAQEIGRVKRSQGLNRFDPVRERSMLNMIEEKNEGPFETSTMQHIFKEIFKASLELQEDDNRKALLVSRKKQPADTVVQVGNEQIGNSKQHLIAGPCSVESQEQVDEVAAMMKKQGLTMMRGGAFKPRSSPYDFQGLGLEGLKILKNAADKYGLSVISEIVTPQDIETAVDYLDVIQIGARNMQNFELLKAAGRVDKPVLLKRGLSATISEFINAAEYIYSQGNKNIILCERGIRTYETATRNTLDISAVPILKQETHLPVLVDVTHSTGRRDLLLPTAKAAFAVGADGVMTEVHPDPAVALSDSAQQMDIPQFESFLESLEASGLYSRQTATVK